MATPQLDERALRRPDWLGGKSLRLADGQEWLLALPEIAPAEAAAGDAFPALDVSTLDELAGADASVASPRVVALALAFGRALLIRNYDLTDDQLAGLLDVGSPATLATLRQHAVRVVACLAYAEVAARLAEIEGSLPGLLGQVSDLEGAIRGGRPGR